MTITTHLILLCAVAALITVMAMFVPTSVGQITSGQQDVVLPPQLILRDTVRCTTGITNMLQQQQSQSQMPSQEQVNYAMGLLLVSSLVELSLPMIAYVMY